MEKGEIRDYEYVLGIDVGKSKHALSSLNVSTGELLNSVECESDEISCVETLAKLVKSKRTLVVLDQAKTFGSTLVRVAQSMNLDVAFISPKDFAQAAKCWGEDKTDRKDAQTMCEIACAMPHLFQLLPQPNEALEQMRVLLSIRDDAVKERTRLYNRLHDAIHQMCPAWEKILSGSKMHTLQALTLLSRYGCPSDLRRAGRRAQTWIAKQRGCSTKAQEFTKAMIEAAKSVTIPIPAEQIQGRNISLIVKRISELEQECTDLETQIDAIGGCLESYTLVRSVPGFGCATSASVAVYAGDINRFKSSSHFAAYAGIAPVNHASGTSVNSKRRRKGCCRHLKNAFTMTASVAAFNDPISMEYYQRKIREGKKHTQAVRSLARRRVDVVFAILKKGKPYKASNYAA